MPQRRIMQQQTAASLEHPNLQAERRLYVPHAKGKDEKRRQDQRLTYLQKEWDRARHDPKRPRNGKDTYLTVSLPEAEDLLNLLGPSSVHHTGLKREKRLWANRWSAYVALHDRMLFSCVTDLSLQEGLT